MTAIAEPASLAVLPLSLERAKPSETAMRISIAPAK